MRGNRFHDCGDPANSNKDHASTPPTSLDGAIIDNVFYNSAGYTIQLYPNAQRTLVAHNVIDGGPDRSAAASSSAATAATRHATTSSSAT